MGKVVIPGFRKIEVSGSGEGGTTNYNGLENKPSINNVPLVGNLSTVNLKLTDATLTEEGVPAEAKTVGTKLEEHSTYLTELSEQLGNHTVKSDVPENAVFTDTVYDDTEVKESIDELNSNLVEQKMLGWTVPSECPIQNEVSGNQFIQKVGRIDLSTLSFSELGNFGYYVVISTSKAPINNSTVANIYLEGFTTVKRIDLDGSPNSIAMTGAKEFCINNGKIAIPSGYLYYELETEITMTIDGNEAITKVNESLDNQGLLNKVTEMQQGRWNISSGVFEDGEYYVSSKESISCNGNSNIKLKCDNAEAFDIVFFNGSSFISGESKNGSELLFTTPSNATSFKFNIYNRNQLTPQNIGKIEVYVDSQIEQLKNDLDKLNSLPIGSIIQIEAAKDNIETTKQKYGWQYLGTSKIECGESESSAKLLVTNVYRKNN